MNLIRSRPEIVRYKCLNESKNGMQWSCHKMEEAESVFNQGRHSLTKLASSGFISLNLNDFFNPSGLD